ncbi:metal ABC transporter permease [Symbiobacterium thermophilum]|jgi:manganese/zinc/iron transport system permease protein|uniref:ABC transporter permease protein n=1 Tax=Symbiobacterium thermophilum (strain DSM 24528 / JCM 14929 / IAM 14863 / T) TaxID=292459 RepID=Q67P99_SYMTH|nr:metal ABC transporter permease [Symbiobacterium thermophilum]BAD40494.1 ABC transporter permease protein [Symbiobacterium thermophilum IAM 14863]
MIAALVIVAVGALVAGSAGLVGSFLVLRRMTMLGDAISHAVLPGIALGFLLTGSRAAPVMLLAAGLFGLLTAYLVQALQRAGVQEDAGMGVTFTAFFSLGVVLISAFAGRVHLDLDHVLYGEIAFAPWDLWVVGGRSLGPRALWTMGAVFLTDLAAVLLFFKELKICAFDPETASVQGVNVTAFHYLLMSLVSLTTVGAFDAVGAILAVAMLVLPGATAYLLTDRLETMLALSVGIGAVTSALGYLLARATDTPVAGAMAVAGGALFALAFGWSGRKRLVRAR